MAQQTHRSPSGLAAPRRCAATLHDMGGGSAPGQQSRKKLLKCLEMSQNVCTFAAERRLTSPSRAFENMTTEELRFKLHIAWKGYGTYRVTINYRGKYYHCLSHNSLAYDRLNCTDIVSDRTVKHFYTYRGALDALYKECKQKNDLY